MSSLASTDPRPSAVFGGVLSRMEQILETLGSVWLLARGYQDPGGVELLESWNSVMDPLLRMYREGHDPAVLSALAGRQLATLIGLASGVDAPWRDHASSLLKQTEELLSEVESRLRRSSAFVRSPSALTASSLGPALQRGPATPLLFRSQARLPVDSRSAPPSESGGGVVGTPALQTATPSGYCPDPLPRLSHAQWCEFHAVDCFADIVALLPQRVPQLGESWVLADFIERRLVANLDGLAALGDDAYLAVERACSHAVVVDAALCAGLALVAGSVESRDLLGLCELFLLTWETDSAMWQAVTDAWKLAPSPWLGALCSRYLESPDPRKVKLALDVLGYRGWLTSDDLVRLFDRRSLPVEELLPYLELLPTHVCHDWLARLYAADIAGAERPALWWASALCGYPPTASILEAAAVADASGEAWMLLALYGERKHAEALLQTFAVAPSATLARSVGWCGLGASIPVLISALTSEDPELKSAIAMALERITAAGLFEEVEVAAERVQDPDVPEPSLGPEPSLTDTVSDDRDAAPQGSPDTLWLPATSIEVWSAYWRDNASRFAPDWRYRCGEPVTPSVLLQELTHALRTPSDRRLVHRELTLRTGRRVNFDPHQWVHEQRARLEEWSAAIATVVVQPGTWFRHHRNR